MVHQAVIFLWYCCIQPFGDLAWVLFQNIDHVLLLFDAVTAARNTCSYPKGQMRRWAVLGGWVRLRYLSSLSLGRRWESVLPAENSILLRKYQETIHAKVLITLARDEVASFQCTQQRSDTRAARGVTVGR